MRLSPIEYYQRRYKTARAKADLWMSLYEACYHYCVPSRNLYYWTSQYQGAQKNAKVYDTTAVAGLRNFVSKMQGALTPPNQNWALLESGSTVPEDMKEDVNEYLQQTTSTIFEYIRKSNFDLAMGECYYDLGVGTACLICLDGGSDDKPLHFYSVPLARLAPEESYSGLLDSCWRWWDEIRIDDILALWPNIKLTPMMQALYESDPNATIKILSEGCVDVPGERHGEYPYRYVVMYENEILLDEPYEYNPFLVFRWSKVNNEVMGRGPVVEALPSILSLNELARLELTSANLNVTKPIMAASDGVFNPWTFKLEPNTIIPVAMNPNGQFPLQPLPDTANPAFMQLTSNDLRMQINKLLYADPLQAPDTPTRTATEIAIRQRNLAEEIGPAFTRLQQEFLPRLIANIVCLLKRRGLIKDLSINGKEIQLKYQSPLVIAQGQQDVQNFIQWYSLVQGIYGEAAPVYLNPVETPLWMAGKMGVDMQVLNKREMLEEKLGTDSELKQEMVLNELEAGREEVGTAA